MKIWYFILCYLLVPQKSDKHLVKTSIEFDILLRNKVVGQLIATKVNKESKTYYHSSTTIKTKIIREVLVNYKYDVVFDHSLLKQADVFITVNDKTHAETHTTRIDDYYQFKDDDKNSIRHHSPINYSTILLYFIEPINIETCFSEEDGSINRIVSLGNHVYKKINSKGKENIYYYKDGILSKAKIDGGLVSFQMIAK